MLFACHKSSLTDAVHYWSTGLFLEVRSVVEHPLLAAITRSSSRQRSMLLTLCRPLARTSHHSIAASLTRSTVVVFTGVLWSLLDEMNHLSSAGNLAGKLNLSARVFGQTLYRLQPPSSLPLEATVSEDFLILVVVCTPRDLIDFSLDAAVAQR